MRGGRRSSAAARAGLPPGRLSARPRSPSAITAAPAGQRAIQGDGLIYVPARRDAARPMPLALMLHGAGGEAGHGIDLLRPFADAAGLILLATASRGSTWDALTEGFGRDVATIDAALAEVFAHHAVDPAHLAIGGFSDGASYALSLGLANGDLFTHVIAFSPGFSSPPLVTGKPRIFVSHGVHDLVLPIAVSSRRLVPRLQQGGYDVTYHEFDGPHAVPPAIASEAVTWLLGQGTGRSPGPAPHGSS